MSKGRPATPKQAARSRHPIDGALDPALFRALGDPTRVRLLACLSKCGRECSVGEAAECCHVDMSVVSRHLAALEAAGVLTSRREGRTVRYRVRFANLSAALRALADAVDACCPDGSRGCGEGSCGCA